VKLRFEVGDEDFSLAGRASSELKRVLGRIGIAPDLIRRVSIAMYEGEINMVIHAGGGIVEAEIETGGVAITLSDAGPGIPDISLAMTEGWSTAPDRYRELGFGAGMGLPNMKRNCDEFEIESEVGKGTRVRMVIKL
jgi:anti-sigma regulatory factor (Ser/Thr protein kinase)